MPRRERDLLNSLLVRVAFVVLRFTNRSETITWGFDAVQQLIGKFLKVGSDFGHVFEQSTR